MSVSSAFSVLIIRLLHDLQSEQLSWTMCSWQASAQVIARQESRVSIGSYSASFHSQLAFKLFEDFQACLWFTNVAALVNNTRIQELNTFPRRLKASKCWQSSLHASP